MKRFFSFLLFLVLMGIGSASSKNWYVIGDFCNWSLEEASAMEVQKDGSYSVTLNSVEGEFKFCADGSWEDNFGGLILGDFREISGNIDFPVIENGGNFKVTSKIRNLKIELNPVEKTVKFSGFQDDMRPVPTITEEGCFLYFINEDGTLGRAIDGTAEEPGVFSFHAPFVPETKFIITTVKISYYQLTTPKKMIFDFLQNFQYGVTGIVEKPLQSEELVSIQNYAATQWNFKEEGHYRLLINLNEHLLRTEPKDFSVYICGEVISPDGYVNNFLAPSLQNEEIYNTYFKLNKTGDLFTGTFFLKERDTNEIFPENLPKFRFFTELLGWTEAASLGSDMEAFFCLPITVSDEYISCPIVKRGRGNWGLMNQDKSWKSGWVDIKVDVRNLMVYFRLNSSGIEEVCGESDDKETWYNLQGIEISSPNKGLNICIRNGKTKKVIVK